MSKPETKRPDTVHADARRFLDERGSNTLAPNGENPATIMEKTLIDRIIESSYYQERCFAVNEADIIDRVVEDVQAVGGLRGEAQVPSPFLCLAFKLLELGPSDAIIAEYLHYGGEHFKYLRALACFYVRLTRPAKAVFEMLEPFLADSRKLRKRGGTGTSLTYVDEFMDDLLTKKMVCGTELKMLPQRVVLEDMGVLEPYESPLGDIDDLLEESEEENEIKAEDEQNGGDAGGDEMEEMELDGRPRRESRTP